MPYGVRQWARRNPSQNPLQVFQSLVTAKGILDSAGNPLEIKAPAVLDYVFKDVTGSGGISPSLANIYLNAESPHQALRAGVTNSTGFQHIRVPEQYSVPLGEVAQGSGVNYETLVAAAQAVSGFDTSIPEPLSQNPQRSIERFAQVNQYLSTQGILSDNPDHENAMMLGFVYGPNLNFNGGILEPTPEQDAYLARIAAAKAGLGDRSQLTNPSLLNPRLANSVRRTAPRTLNRVQIVDVLRQAGWPENLLSKASGIAMLESSGRTAIDTSMTIDPDRSNEYSIGILQVNYQAHKPMLDKMGISEQDLRDPLINARVAYRIYKMQGWGAWYNSNNKYKSNYEGIQNFTLN